MTSDPSVEPLDSELQQLAEAGRQGLPSSGQLAGVEAALGPLLNAPVVAPLGHGGSNLPLLTKLGALLGLGAAATVAGVYMTGGSEPAGVPALQSQEPTKTERVSVVTPPAPEVAEAPPSEGSVKTPAISEPPSEAQPSATAPKHAATPKPSESALLERARQALKQNPRAALSLTQRHKRLYPQGVLAQEREVLAIEALSRLKRREEAGRRAGAFEDAYPDSAHKEKVRGAQKPK